MGLHEASNWKVVVENPSWLIWPPYFRSSKQTGRCVPVSYTPRRLVALAISIKQHQTRYINSLFRSSKSINSFRLLFASATSMLLLTWLLPGLLLLLKELPLKLTSLPTLSQFLYVLKICSLIRLMFLGVCLLCTLLLPKTDSGAQTARGLLSNLRPEYRAGGEWCFRKGPGSGRATCLIIIVLDGQQFARSRYIYWISNGHFRCRKFCTRYVCTCLQMLV